MTTPRLSAYNLRTVLGLRKKLAEEVTLHYFACDLVGADFADFVAHLGRLLPAGVDRDALHASMRHLAGRPLDDARVDELAWRLAGNVDSLKKGRPVPPWTRQAGPRWCPLRVERVEPGSVTVRDRNAAPPRPGLARPRLARKGGTLTLRVLAGPPAGHTLTRFWSTAYAHSVKLELGFSRFDRERYSRVVSATPNYPLRDVRELTRVRFYALFTPESCREGLGFEAVKGNAATTAWNRSLFRMRRRSGFACPLAYPLSQVPCHRCERGYDTCAAGCHPTSYVLAFCAGCGKDAWHDPAAGREVCVDCPDPNS